MTAQLIQVPDSAVTSLVHHALRRDAAAYCAAVGTTPTADRATWRTLAEHWDRFAEALHHHDIAHRELDAGLRACDELWTRLARHDDPDARAALRVRLTALRECLGRHLAHQETDARRFGEGVGLRTALRLVPWLLHDVPVPARRAVFAQPGGTAHRVVWWVTRPGFRRLHRRAFRYANR